MILTVDRKHLFLCSSIILVSNGTSIFLREKVSETKDFIEKANGGKSHKMWKGERKNDKKTNWKKMYSDPDRFNWNQLFYVCTDILITG